MEVLDRGAVSVACNFDVMGIDAAVAGELRAMSADDIVAVDEGDRIDEQAVVIDAMEAEVCVLVRCQFGVIGGVRFFVEEDVFNAIDEFAVDGVRLRRSRKHATV